MSLTDLLRESFTFIFLFCRGKFFIPLWEKNVENEIQILIKFLIYLRTDSVI